MESSYLHKFVMKQININFALYTFFVILFSLYLIEFFKSKVAQNIIFAVMPLFVVAYYFNYYRKEKKAFKKMLIDIL